MLGDVVRVQAGQAFPADGTVLSHSATVDEALLTGESRPVVRLQGESVVAGSFNLAGPVELRVDRLGRDTRFAQIVSLMEKGQHRKAPPGHPGGSDRGAISGSGVAGSRRRGVVLVAD